jgi:cytochrome c-type biogenesis protein CcmF
MPMTEAGIGPGIGRDLYVTLGNIISENKWSVRIYYKPLIRLIWIGALIMILGGVLSILLDRRKQLNYKEK